MHHPRLAITAALLGLAAALPAFAAGGDPTSIELYDLNRNGRIDRAIVSVANPSHTAWTVERPVNFGIRYENELLPITSVYLASSSTADPVRIEIAIDENDVHVPDTTSVDGFELSYVPSGTGKGVVSGSLEMGAIAEGDATVAATEIDRAAPILLDSYPRHGMYDAQRVDAVSLTFSEPLAPSSLTFLSSRDPGEWSATWEGSTVRLQHRAYAISTDIQFEITAGSDVTGNTLIASGYPNPFNFRTAESTSVAPKQNPTLLFTVPTAGTSLPAGEASTLAWHSTTPGLDRFRLSYSTDLVTYTPFAEMPAGSESYVWYPPNKPGTLSLRLDGLAANGAVLNAVFANGLTIAASASNLPVSVLVPAWVYPGQAATRIGVDLDRQPTHASLSCDGTAVPGLRTTGFRPVRLEADVAGLSLNVMHACAFSITDAFNRVSTVTAPSFRIDDSSTPADDEAYEAEVLFKGSGSAVYWVTGGKRYAFPNETVYRSWFGTDFSGVSQITDAALAAYPLGGNVKMKEGVYFVKIQSDPKTYAVEPNGVLRWIPSEAEAIRLAGAAWASRVRDVDVSLFVNYTIGAPLASGETPTGHRP